MARPSPCVTANGPSSVSPASSKRISGNVEKGIEVALDIEEIVYEVNTFLNAVIMIDQLGKN